MRTALRAVLALAVIVASAVPSCSPDRGVVGATAARPQTTVIGAALAMRDGNAPSILVESPEPGSLVTSPVTISVAVTGFSLAPAGRVVDGEGHLHFMIDRPCLVPGTVMPKDATHVHVGDGSHEVTLDLAPGPHTICVQVGDGFHTAVGIVDSVDLLVAAGDE